MSEGCKNGYDVGLCRFCANNHPGFEIFSELGLEQGLLSKVNSCCLPFKVSEDDVLPTFICYICIYKVNSYVDFHTASISAQTKLRRLHLSKDDSTTIGGPSTSIGSNHSESAGSLSAKYIHLHTSFIAKMEQPIIPELVSIELSDDEKDIYPQAPHKKQKIVSGKGGADIFKKSVDRPTNDISIDSNKCSAAVKYGCEIQQKSLGELLKCRMKEISSDNNKSCDLQIVPLIDLCNDLETEAPEKIKLKNKVTSQNEKCLGLIDITGPKPDCSNLLTIDITDPEPPDINIESVFTLNNEKVKRDVLNSINAR